jgi:hypothetical protein
MQPLGENHEPEHEPSVESSLEALRANFRETVPLKNVLEQLPGAVRDDINHFLAEHYVAFEERLFHELVFFIFDRDEWRAGEKLSSCLAPVMDDIKALGSELRDLSEANIKLVADLEALLKTADPDLISKAVEDGLYPHLGQVQDWFHRAIALQKGIDELMPTERRNFDCSYINRNNAVGDIRLMLKSMCFDLYDERSVADVCSAVVGGALEILGPSALVMNEKAPEVLIKPDELKYAVGRTVESLKNANYEMCVAALEDSCCGNRIYDRLADASSYERALLEHFFFGTDEISVTVGPQGEIVFSVDLLSELHEEWQLRVEQLRSELKPVQMLAERYSGQFEFEIKGSGTVLELKLSLPFKGSGEPGTVTNCEQDLQFYEGRRFKSGIAGTSIWLKREVTQGSGEVKSYFVEAQGGVLMSSAAAVALKQKLKIVDEMVAAVPELQKVTLSASGTEDDIRTAYEKGKYEISLSSKAQEFHKGPHKSGNYIRKIREPFIWETDPELASEEKGDNAAESCREVYRDLHLRFDVLTFEDVQLRELAVKACQRTPNISLPLEHDQERRISKPERYCQQLRRMLTELDKVLEQVERNSQGPLNVLVMPVIALRVAQVGTFDGIFQLEVADAQGRMVAKGKFSREYQNFRWKPIDVDQVQTARERIMAVVDELSGDPKLSLRRLDRGMERAGITLPDRSMESLLDAMKGISHDRYFAAPSPQRVLQSMLEDPRMFLKLSDEELEVIELEVDPTRVSALAFGVIVSLDEDDPAEEIVNYEMAKNLYEKEYPFFMPNRHFMERYESEKDTPPDKSE